jgi:hypothetical protein
MRARILGLVATATTLLGISGAAYAVPVLQLGIVGGTYDDAAGVESVIAPGPIFKLVAILTPGEGAKPADIAAYLADNYYVSAALVPKTGPADSNQGSFVFNGVTVASTADMTYGTPPLTAVLDGLNGDLGDHGIFDTFFSEFGFQFNSLNTLSGCSGGDVNVQDNPGLTNCMLGNSGIGTQYWASFDVNVTDLLKVLHFYLYNDKIKCLGKGGPSPPCDGDSTVQVDDFAPFSHDAQSSSTSSSGTSSSGSDVPEPGTLTLLGLGLLGLGYARRSKKAA